jgi:hypothetical protein
MLALSFCLIVIAPASAQNRLTSPKDHFGFNIGDDYQLANYTQYEAYIKKLDQESDRLKVWRLSPRPKTTRNSIVTRRFRVVWRWPKG